MNKANKKNHLITILMEIFIVSSGVRLYIYLVINRQDRQQSMESNVNNFFACSINGIRHRKFAHALKKHKTGFQHLSERKNIHALRVWIFMYLYDYTEWHNEKQALKQQTNTFPQWNSECVVITIIDKNHCVLWWYFHRFYCTSKIVHQFNENNPTIFLTITLVNSF